MAINSMKENQADMTYAEIEAWHDQCPSMRMKPNLTTYIIWKDGMFMGEGDFYHKQSSGEFQYSHTVDYGDPQEYPETVSGDAEPGEAVVGDYTPSANPGEEVTEEPH